MATTSELAHEWRLNNKGLPMESVVTGLYKMILELETRFDEVVPTEELMAKYPALKEAWEQYRVIRKVVGNE